MLTHNDIERSFNVMNDIFIERSWLCTVEGLKRIKSMERDKILAENRRKFMK
ncbi:MAG: hypothetical protein J6Q69_01325 [Clostridia bacterium]|nr:hypothetical protein [Clostridia bacterium]